MKKTLFFILAVAFCVSLTAQTKLTSKDFKNLKSTPQYHGQTIGANADDGSVYTPVHRPSNFAPQTRGSLSEIGATHYILQTNSCARNMINWSPDGATCAAVWTTGAMPSGSPLGGNRGTAINYYDQASNSWGPSLLANPITRIETGPETKSFTPGWGTHAYTVEGECLVSHCSAADGILINTREKRGEGSWVQDTLHGPLLSNGKHGLFWPTMCAVGNTLHLFCVTDGNSHHGGGPFYPPTNTEHAPLYYRSTDGGKTWEEPIDFVGILPLEDLIAISGDDYVVTARGNHVVIAYMSNCQVAYLESQDGGNTWEKKQVYYSPWSWTSTGVRVGPVVFPTTLAVAIGDDAVVHIAFSVQMKMRDAETDPYYVSSYFMLCGLYTWNDKNPPMTEEDMGVVFNEAENKIEDWSYDLLPNYMDAPALTGLDTFHWWQPFYEPEEMFLSNHDMGGYITQPRLIAEGGKVYLLYTSILEQPLLCPDNEKQFMRGIFLTVSFDNGTTYKQQGNTSWLSYDPELFNCDWSNWFFDRETQQCGGEIDVLVFSESGYPSMAPSIVNDKLVFTWLNDLLPFPERDASGAVAWVTTEPPFRVFSLAINKNEAGTTYNNTQYLPDKINEQAVQGKLKVYPNPAQGNVRVELNHNDPFTLTVTNLMGQVVFTTKGESKTEFSVANYPKGIYIVNVKTAKTITSQKLIVQ